MSLAQRSLSVLVRSLVMNSRIFVVTVALTALATPARAQTVAVEADALAYPLGGYSAALRITHGSGFSYALGTGRYSLPTFVVKGQSTYDEARWQATSEAIQVLRVGYRFLGPRVDGPAVDAIVLNQLWHVEAPRLGEDTHFKTLGMGISGGYYVHIGSHVYVYPTAALTYETVYAGSTSVKDREYKVSPIGINGSMHLGWEL